MKKVLSIIFFLGVLFVSTYSTYSDTKTYSWSGNDPITITVTSPTSIEYHVTFSATDTYAYNPSICIATVTDPSVCLNTVGDHNNDPSVLYVQNYPEVYPNKITGVNHNTVADDTVTGLDATKTYTFIVFGSGVDDNKHQTSINYQFSTGSTVASADPNAKAVFIPLTTSLSGSTLTVSGRLDPAANPWLNTSTKNFKATLVYSPSPTTDSNKALNTVTGGPFNATINSDGSYSWDLNTGNMSGVTYYIQQTVTPNSTTTGSLDTVDTVNIGTGNIVIPNTASAVADAAKRSYSFLSSPGTIIPDPDLCAQQQAQNPNVHCDINYYINLALQFLIGLSGVALVLRLMYEGFIIMTTDIPFIQAKSKKGFQTAALGLMIALSSYVILKTINPKLVNESVGVTPLSIIIDQDGDTNAPTTFVTNGQLPQNIYCPGLGKGNAVSKVAQSFIGRVTYAWNGKDATVQPDGTAHLDCSGWANTVLKCSGYAADIDYVNSGSGPIFAAGEAANMSTFIVNGSTVSFGGRTLNPGDLVGWPSNGSKTGHVILYIGNGQFMDDHVHGGVTTTEPWSATQIKNMYGGSGTKTITSVKRIPI